MATHVSGWSIVVSAAVIVVTGNRHGHLSRGVQVHAEQFVMANAWAHRERGIKRLAVSAAPCGHCRQFYAELPSAVRLSTPHVHNCT